MLEIQHFLHVVFHYGLVLLGDQTPTPTRFLKSCEEFGLFQEFTRNPFDDEFKKAADQATSASHEVKTSVGDEPAFKFVELRLFHLTFVK
jgi:hypothetical protein